MKKVYILLSAACVVASAVASDKFASKKDLRIQSDIAQKYQSNEKVSLSKVEMTEKSVVNIHKAKSITRADETEETAVYPFYRPALDIFAVGMSENGYGLKNPIGFHSTYGSLDFYSFCTGASDIEWKYSELNGYIEGTENWDVKNSNETILRVKSGLGEVMTPSITALSASGAQKVYAPKTIEYLCAATPVMFGFDDPEGGEYGVTSCQNYGLSNYSGRSFGNSYASVYCKVDSLIQKNEFNANGVYVDPSEADNWQSRIEGMADGMNITDLALQNYTCVIPKPASGYMFTKSWYMMYINASAATQLISNVYTIDENGEMSDTPIAVGYAAIPQGDNDGYFAILKFNYNKIDEEGDEVEEDIIINSAIAVTIEGFAGNDAIIEIIPTSGFAPINLNQYKAGAGDILAEPTFYLNFSCKADGQQINDILLADNYYLWPFDNVNNPEEMTLYAYSTLCLDAQFSYIYDVNGVESVKIPAAGGKAEVTLDAFYYNLKDMTAAGYYEISAPEWLTVELSAYDPKTYQTVMTVSAEAAEAGRTGVVTIEGLGATYSLEVVQGEGAAVNVTLIDSKADYYDLAGRKVANPEKGIYIKKSANKTEKVIL